MIIRLFRDFTFLFIIAVFVAVGHPVRAESASSVVERFQASLIQVMQSASESSVRQRYDRLVHSVSDTFHLPLMTQIATGRHWSTAKPTEKTAVVAAFRRMSVATLATLFDGYSGEIFKTVGERPGPSKATIVLTKLVRSDKSKVDLAYVARQFAGKWQLIDVVVDSGISELKVRRSEYSMVLKNSGMPGLTKLLNEKADDLMSR
tara:strand:+ start:627 stop:1241 length:615 start_codon:yes stop_codon:yes gene_type:complete